MKRNPRKASWTKAFRKAAGKELAIDSTFEFEKKPNVAVRYDRDLVRETVEAIQKVQKIKSKREMKFYKQRMAGKAEAEKAQAQKEVLQNVELLGEKAASSSLGRKIAIKAANEAGKRMEIDE